MTQNNAGTAATAKGYVASFFKGESFPGGFAYREELKACNLDFSMDSLKRIDALLDRVREAEKPQFEVFMDQDANQHFLHFLAFYAGYAASKTINLEPHWYTREEAIAVVPQLQHVWKEDLFETSIICMFRPAGLGSQQYPPLVSIVTRLFEGPGKSVWASANGLKFALEKSASTESKAPAPKQEEGLFKKFRRILNSIRG